MTSEIYRALGPISIAITWLGLAFLVYKWPGEVPLSFGLRAAAHRKSYLLYLGIFVVTLPLFFVFIVKWFVPVLHLPHKYIYIALAAVLLQLVVAIVPEVKGKKARIHRASAGIMTFLLIPLTLFIATATNLSTSIRFMAFLDSLLLLFIWGLFILIEPFHKHFLYLQTAYVAIFHVTILAATYLG
jgi:hypothetical protein